MSNAVAFPATTFSFADGWCTDYSGKDSQPRWFPANMDKLLQGRQRDNMQSTQDVQSGELSLDEVDRRWKHRVGWPRLLNAPVSTDDATKHDYANESLEALHSHINEILGKYQISQRGRLGFHISYRQQRRHWQKLHFGLLRVLVECVYDPEKQERHPDSWSLAVIDIHKAIRDVVNDPRDIGIELYDGVYERSIQLSPDFPADCQDVITNWSGGCNYRQQVLDLFENQPYLWQAMLLTGLKASNEHTKDHKCVLWLDAIDTENPLWPQMETKLASILPNNVSVEIWQASHAILCSSPESTESNSIELSNTVVRKDLMQEDFRHPPKPGSSIGVMADALGAGTLGGYIRVSKTVEPGSTPTFERTYGLTNAHVVLGLDPKSFRQLWLKERLLFTTDSTERLPVQCPSKRDCNHYLDAFNDMVKTSELMIRGNFERLSHLYGDSAADDSVSRLESGIARSSSRINQIMLATQMEREGRYVGDVRAVSFDQRSHKSTDFSNRLAMDLALIDMTQLIPDPSVIHLRKRHPQLPPDRIPGTWDVDRLSSEASDDRTNLVAMFGRSGFKEGRLHPIKVDIKLLDLDKRQHTFSAWTVVSTQRMEPFAEPGDSGSFIFAGRGWELGGLLNESIKETKEEPELSVVGMLFASSPDGRLGYFIPFDAIIDEVEALTGGKVTWPVKKND